MQRKYAPRQNDSAMHNTLLWT